MDRLYSWEAKRAGAAITINHSCGKIVGIAAIKTQDKGDASGRQIVVAIGNDGRTYQLS